jgi:20S proteasome alpha/beta subunit
MLPERKPPIPFRRKRRLPERERTVTIAAGFLCSDGIVLAADRLYTGISKRFGKKVWWFQAGDTTVAIAVAGIATYIRHVKEAMRNTVRDRMTVEEIIQKANDIVFALQHKHASAMPGEEWELDLLIGTRTPSGCSLHENQNAYLFVPVEDETQCRCIGSGNRIGVYLIEWLFRPALTTQWATTIAAHALTQAIGGDPNCGGQRDILVVPQAIDQQPYETEQRAISLLTDQLSKIERAVREVLVFAPGSNLNEETIELRFQALEDAVRAARNVTIRLSGVASIGIVGAVGVLTDAPSDATQEPLSPSDSSSDDSDTG